jgi:hypothetical protein
MKSHLKRGSLSLSINAVVILVLAIAMLGLGLGFTKKMFAKFGDTLQIPEPELTASESEPIVLTSDSLEIKSTKPTSVPLKYYNTGASAWVFPYLDCNTPCGTAGQATPIYVKAAGVYPSFAVGTPLWIAQGEQKTFRIQLKANFLDSAEPTKICTLNMVWDGASSASTSTDPWSGTGGNFAGACSAWKATTSPGGVLGSKQITITMAG